MTLTALPNYDAIVIGGGFYGCVIGHYLKANRKLEKVLLIEESDALCQRASFNNQARIHNGYHYPRSYVTAFRSRTNLPRFIRDFPNAVFRDFRALYAIARNQSKINAQQFETFCSEIGAELKPAPLESLLLFNSALIERVFEVREYAFDAEKLRTTLTGLLNEANVELKLGCSVTSISDQPDFIRISHSYGAVTAKRVFNCTYSRLNQLKPKASPPPADLKHEITEMGLLTLPPELSDTAITVMDGPFFSLMPFPSRKSHTLSHVRYTPQRSWRDSPQIDPYQELNNYNKESRVELMLRDASRYLPILSKAKQCGSLFEVKSVLLRNEGDDGRPILLSIDSSADRVIHVLGGKIDNVYDVLERLDQLEFG